MLVDLSNDMLLYADRSTLHLCEYMTYITNKFSVQEIERQIARERERERDRDRQTDRQIERQTERTSCYEDVKMNLKEIHHFKELG